MEMDGMWIDPQFHIHIHQNPRNQSGCGWMWMDLNGYPFSSIYQNVLGFLGGLESMYELLRLRVSNHDYRSISPLVGVARCHGFAPSPQPEIASFKTP